MKIKRKILTGLLIGSTIFSSLGGLSYAENDGSWKQEEKNWYYYNSDGELYKNNWLLYKEYWYYFGFDGKMITDSFIDYNGNKYYLNEYGEMVVNKVVNGYKLDENGIATKILIKDSWKKEENNWYYYGSTGELYKNSWLSYNKNWYYFGADGKMLADSFVDYNGKKYYFGVTGEMVVNKTVRGYELNEYGEATKIVIKNEWRKEDTNWNYYGSDGEMYKNRWLSYKDNWYYFDSKGNMVTDSFVDYNGKKYYLGKTGEMVVNSTVNGYEINENGEAVKTLIKNEWKQEGQIWYYYGSDGKMYKNTWLLYNEKWYYFNSNGKMLTDSFIDYKGSKYYVDESGAMVVDRIVSGYKLDENGVATKLDFKANEWRKDGGDWYYHGENGEIFVNKWLVQKNEWYYFGSNGKMATNSFIDSNGNRYLVDNDGKRVKGFAKDSNGNVYYFSVLDGAMQTNLFAYNKATGIGYNIGSDGIGVVSNSPRKDFIDMVAPYVLNSVKDKGLFPSVAIAQTCLETGFGSSTLGYAPVYNLFGIKAPVGAKESEYIAVWTTEFIGGKEVEMIDKFKKFESYKDAFDYYAGLFTKTDWLRNHYKNVISAKTPEDACKALTGTYATDPEYGKKLLKIIEEFDLKEFDKKIYTNGVK